jgi:Protein of unknown function (DUF3800)
MPSGRRKRDVERAGVRVHLRIYSKSSFRELLLFMTTKPTSAIVYLDESGDLGWTFTAPYNAGGSSRHLTITAVCVPSENRHIPKRVVKSLYERFNWPTTIEKKWAMMTQEERQEFARAARSMCDKHPEVSLHAIVVRKENVQDHIRNDSNKLYNYMIRLSLVDRLSEYDNVVLVPDPRSIKVKSGNSLHDYLLTELWFTKGVKTMLQTNPMDSKTCLGIQFADMLAGAVQGHFEGKRNDCFEVLRPKITLKCLFFNS